MHVGLPKNLHALCLQHSHSIQQSQDRDNEKSTSMARIVIEYIDRECEFSIICDLRVLLRNNSWTNNISEFTSYKIECYGLLFYYFRIINWLIGNNSLKINNDNIYNV